MGAGNERFLFENRSIEIFFHSISQPRPRPRRPPPPKKKKKKTQLRVHQAALGALARRRAPPGKLGVARDRPGAVFPPPLGRALLLKRERERNAKSTKRMKKIKNTKRLSRSLSLILSLSPFFLCDVVVFFFCVCNSTMVCKGEGIEN